MSLILAWCVMWEPDLVRWLDVYWRVEEVWRGRGSLNPAGPRLGILGGCFVLHCYCLAKPSLTPLPALTTYPASGSTFPGERTRVEAGEGRLGLVIWNVVWTNTRLGCATGLLCPRPRGWGQPGSVTHHLQQPCHITSVTGIPQSRNHCHSDSPVREPLSLRFRCHRSHYNFLLCTGLAPVIMSLQLRHK